jgi:hypothetical protein
MNRRAFVFGTAALAVPMPGIVRAASLMDLTGYPLVEPGRVWIRGRDAYGRLAMEVISSRIPSESTVTQFRYVIGYGNHWREMSPFRKAGLIICNAQLQRAPSILSVRQTLISPGIYQATFLPVETAAPRSMDLALP